jgi:hypothetical protein
MKNLIIIIPAIFILLVISGCKLIEPSNPPKYRIQNYCDYIVDYKIIPMGLDTVRYDNIQNNTSRDFTNIKEGNVNVIVSVQGKSDVFIDNFIATKNHKYTITMHDGAVFGQHTINLAISDEPLL